MRKAVHAALLAPALAYFAPVLFWGRALYFRDTGLYFYPHRRMAAEALHALRLPQWNPNEFGGLPLLADPNFNVFHPLSLVTWLLPLPWSFGLFTALAFVIAAYGVRALARELGLDELAAVTAALIFVFCGSFLSLTQGGQIVGPAFMPWICAAALRLRRSVSRRSIAWMAIASALLLLSGTPEIGACAFLFGLLLVWPGGRGARLACLAACALGAGLATIQLLPTALFLRESARGGQGFSYADATNGSFWLRRLPELLVPYFSGSPDGGTWLYPTDERNWLEQAYFGAAPLALAVCGLRSSRAWRVLWLAALALLCVSFGRHTALYPLLWKLLPPLHNIRFPEKFIVPLALPLALSAGAGLRALLAAAAQGTGAAQAGEPRAAQEAAGAAPVPPCAHVPERSDKLVRPPCDVSGRWNRISAGAGAGAGAGALAALLAAVLAAPAAYFALQRLPVPAWRMRALQETALLTAPRELILLAVTLALLALRTRLSARSLALCLALLLAVDLGVPAARMDLSVPQDELTRPSPLLSQLAGAPWELRVDVHAAGVSAEEAERLGEPGWPLPRSVFRLRRRGLFDANAAADGVQLSLGYSGFPSGRMRAVAENHGKRAADLLGIRYGVEYGRPGPSFYGKLGFVPLGSLDDGWVRLSRNDAAQPRLTLWPDAVAGEGLSECGAPTLPGATRACPLEPFGRARIVRYEPERVEAEIDAPAPGVLRLADTMAAGWRVSIDGAPAEALQSDGGLRAVRVPEGRHAIVWTYRAPGLLAGALVSLLSLALLLALLR